MAAPESWSFTTGTELQVTGRTPAPFATGISPRRGGACRVLTRRGRGHASRPPASGSRVRAAPRCPPACPTTPPRGRPRLTPAAPLALLTGYTATLAGTIRAADGAPLAGTSWSFTTAAERRRRRRRSRPPRPPPAPAGVPNGTAVSASFDSRPRPGHRRAAELHAHARGRRPGGGGAWPTTRRHAAPRSPRRRRWPWARATRPGSPLRSAPTSGAPLAADVELVVHHGRLPVLADELPDPGPDRPAGARLPARPRPVLVRARHEGHGGRAHRAGGAALLQGARARRAHTSGASGLRRAQQLAQASLPERERLGLAAPGARHPALAPAGPDLHALGGVERLLLEDRGRAQRLARQRAAARAWRGANGVFAAGRRAVPQRFLAVEQLLRGRRRAAARQPASGSRRSARSRRSTAPRAWAWARTSRPPSPWRSTTRP